MCTVPLPPGVYPIVVDKYIIYHISPHRGLHSSASVVLLSFLKRKVSEKGKYLHIIALLSLRDLVSVSTFKPVDSGVHPPSFLVGVEGGTEPEAIYNL